MSRVTARGALLAFLLSSPGALYAAPAPDSVVQLACAAGDPTTDRPITTTDLAQALLVQSGYPINAIVALAAGKSPEQYRDILLRMAITGDGLTPAVKGAVRGNALGLAQELASPEEDSSLVIASGAAPPRRDDSYWFFKAPSATFTCKAGKAVQTVLQQVREPVSIPIVGIVKTPEDLGTSDDRASVDSATIGLDVSRTKADDGSRKRTSTLSVDGTIGVRLNPHSTPTFLYANYTLARARTHPAPPLDPGARRDDDDTNGLALGLLLGDIAPIPELSVNGSIAYVMDFVKGSRRGVASLLFQPGFAKGSLLFCGLGRLQKISLGAISFRSKCVLEGEMDFSHVFRVGSAEFAKRGDFVAIGGAIGFEIAPPLRAKSGLAGSLIYRFLPTIRGHAPTVHRLDASLKYRWWVADGVGVDFGAVYKHGEELKTYTNENEYLLTFGVVM